MSLRGDQSFATRCHEAAEITIHKPDKRGKENIYLQNRKNSEMILNQPTSDEKSRNKLKNERKTSQKTIRTLLQQKETEKLNAQLEFIENITRFEDSLD